MKKFLMLFVVTSVTICVFVGCSNSAGGALSSTTDLETTSPNHTIESSGIVDNSGSDDEKISYIEYNNMPVEEQSEFVNQFETIDDFFDWYDEAKQQYENSNITSDEYLFATEPVVSAPGHDTVAYLDYHSMTADQQLAFINSFGSIDRFMEWHTNAKQKYMDSLIEFDSTTPIELDKISGSD